MMRVFRGAEVAPWNGFPIPNLVRPVCCEDTSIGATVGTSGGELYSGEVIEDDKDET